jgi:ABC-type amino acid transport substrate-binding protein
MTIIASYTILVGSVALNVDLLDGIAKGLSLNSGKLEFQRTWLPRSINALKGHQIGLLCGRIN